MQSNTYFKQKILPYLLVAPQLIVTLLFFIYPAINALWQAFLRGDAWGIHSKFVGLANFRDLFVDPYYLSSFYVTLVFSVSVTVLALGLGLLMATLTDRVIKGRAVYRTLLIWPYAVAPAIAAVLWKFLFNPSIGLVPYIAAKFGYDVNYLTHGTQAMFLVVIAAAWQQFSYNFIFFLAGLQAIPKTLIEAAALDGAGPFKRFCTVIFPLLSPTTFFLIIMNIIFAFFATFGIIHIITQGGPGNATEILVYKVYYDGFIGLDLGGSSAQSVILMLLVMGLTLFQFKYIERKVHY